MPANMMRQRRGRGHPDKVKERRPRSDNSRLAPLVINNPINQSASWSQESYLLKDLVKEFELPQVVRCANKLVPGEDECLPINIYVPMLLCSIQTATKLLARHVGLDARTQHLTETDDTIVIPSDYDGHFLRLQARTTKDISVVRTLQHIAQNRIPAFINLTPITSFACSDNLKGSSNNLNSNASEISGSHVSSKTSKSTNRNGAHILPQLHMLHPAGSVFVVSGTAKGVTKVKRKTREIILLRCSSEDGNEVFIPSDQKGEILEVETPTNGSTKLSILPQDLILAKRYPQLVRYVYGNHPPRLTPCSKMFTLIDTFEESSLIGCLLYPNHALMIEIPMMSSLNFQVATNHEEVMSMQLPRHAMEVVQNRREVFVRDLKLKCKFMHQVSYGFGQPIGSTDGYAEDDMPSVTVRARQPGWSGNPDIPSIKWQHKLHSIGPKGQ